MYQFELTYDGTTTLVTDPIGWDSLSIEFERDKLLGGFLFGFSPVGASLEFVTDGYTILRDAYDTDGIGANVQIEIYDNTVTPRSLLFAGRCNMGTIQFDLLRCTASVEIETYDVVGRVRSGLNTKLNLLAAESVDGFILSEVPVQETVTILEQQLLRVTEVAAGDSSGSETGVGVSGTTLRDAVNTDVIFQDEVSYNLASPDKQVDGSNVGPSIGANIVWPGAGTWQFDWAVDEVLATLSLPINGIFNIAVEVDPGNNVLAVVSTMILDPNDTFNFRAGPQTASSTIVVSGANPGRVCIRILSETANADVDYTITGFRWRLTRALDFADSPCKTLFAHEACQAALNILSDGGVEDGLLNFRSDLLGKADTQFPPTPAYSGTGTAALLTITDGLSIREYPSQELNASLNDLLRTVVTLYAAGAGLTFDSDVPTFRIEERGFFYDDSETLFILSEYQGLQLTPNLEETYTSIVQGFKRFDVESFSGFFDIHNQQTWVADTRAPENILSNVAPLIGSSYIIEVVRRQSVLTDGSTSTNYDKELFALMVGPDGMSGYHTQRQDELSFFGVAGTVNARNADIHPTRSVIRWLPFIGTNIRNTAVEGVREYTRDAASDRIFANAAFDTEGPPIEYAITDVPGGDKVFGAPNLLTLTTPLLACQLDAFKANPYAQVCVLIGSTYTFWFVQAVSFGLGDGTVEWTLVQSATADSNLAPTTTT